MVKHLSLFEMNEFLDPTGDQLTPEENDIDRALRPENFDDFAGQESILENLGVLWPLQIRRRSSDHTLFMALPDWKNHSGIYIG